MFKDSCRDKYNNTANETVGWTLVSNADIKPDQNLELLKLISNENELNRTLVQGMIMISDSNPSPLDDSQNDEQNKFKWPPLLAITKTKNIREIRPYCYNEPSYANNTNVTLEFKHTFVENCYLLKRLQPWLGLMSAYGLIFGLVWVCSLYKI